MDEQSQNGDSFPGGIFQAHFNIASWKESIEKDGSVVYSITGETVYGQFLKICSFGIYKARKSFKLECCYSTCESYIEITNFLGVLNLIWKPNHNHEIFNDDEERLKRQEVFAMLENGEYVEGQVECKKVYNIMLMHKHRIVSDPIENLQRQMIDYEIECVENGIYIHQEATPMSVALQVKGFGNSGEAILLISEDTLFGIYVGEINGFAGIVEKFQIKVYLVLCHYNVIKLFPGVRINYLDVLAVCHARFNEPEFSDLLLGTMEIHEEARGKLTQKVKGSYMGRLMTWKKRICSAWCDGPTVATNKFWWRCRNVVYDVYDVDIAVIQLLEAKGERDDGIVGYDILGNNMGGGAPRNREKVNVRDMMDVINEILERDMPIRIDESAVLSRKDKKILEEYNKKGKQVVRILGSICK